MSCPLALLVDMDGVIRYWDDGPGRVDEALGLPVGTFAFVALEPDRVRRANDGTITDEEWRAEVAGVLAAEHGCELAKVPVAWDGDGFRIDGEVVDLVRAVREAGGLTACVSNATTRLEADIAERGIGDAFGVVVNSSRVGVMKPDPAIYDIAAEAVATSVSDCLFVDDRPENVAGALAAGMPAVRFTTSGRLAATLRRVGLLPAET